MAQSNGGSRGRSLANRAAPPRRTPLRRGRARPADRGVINQRRGLLDIAASGSTPAAAPDSLPCPVPTVLEMVGDRRRIQYVEYAALRHATLPRHFHAPMR